MCSFKYFIQKNKWYSATNRICSPEKGKCCHQSCHQDKVSACSKTLGFFKMRYSIVILQRRFIITTKVLCSSCRRNRIKSKMPYHHTKNEYWSIAAQWTWHVQRTSQQIIFQESLNFSGGSWRVFRHSKMFWAHKSYFRAFWQSTASSYLDC